MLQDGDALLIVDVQRDFLPGGALAVPDGDAVVPALSECARAFAERHLPVFASRDWHPADHCSFREHGGPWPPHCVENTPGAEFDPVDTYETLAAAHAVTKLARRLRAEGVSIHSVRLDSGDLPSLAVKVREILDAGGCENIRIFCSGGIDEYALARDFRGLPVDGFGIGTHLDVSADAPYLDCAYKLQQYASVPRRKRSTGKATWPGRKQVFRRFDDDGVLRRDVVAREQDVMDGEPLLLPVMRNGQRLQPAASLETLRKNAAANLAALPGSLRSPVDQGTYDVEIAPSLHALAAELDSLQPLSNRELTGTSKGCKQKATQETEWNARERERLAAKSHLDHKLDEALDETFPASDPIELSAKAD
jgi:hypothetical protein